MTNMPRRHVVQQPGFSEFLALGIKHILTGYDHLLFLCALFPGCSRLKTMLAVVTGFTLAHSVTLALAALNLVTITPRVVEPLIALSIIFVAAEKAWPRYLMTCGFGLIHGFAFAGALRMAGMATGGSSMAVPLIAFNSGVEIGQLAVVAVVLPVLLILRKRPLFRRFGVRLISGTVLLVAVFWLWQGVTSSGD